MGTDAEVLHDVPGNGIVIDVPVVVARRSRIGPNRGNLMFN